jgi:hypothetical protein
MWRKYIALFVFFLVFFSQSALSQDHHYWTQQFGSRSALMGGAVVGGVRDTSAGFYNPGALGFVNQPTLSVSANGYQLERLSIENGIGTGEDLTSEKLTVIPSLASGTLVFERFPDHAFGYTLLAKNQTAVDMSGRIDKTFDVIGDIPYQDGRNYFQGQENFAGQVIANSEVTELWAGLSWARKIRPNISVGATTFFALRNQSQGNTITGRVTNGDMLVTQDQLNYIDFWNLRTLLKLGVAAEFEGWKLGLTLTTPSRNLFGQGTVTRERSFNNFYDTEKNQFVGELISNRQDNLDTTYRNPLSIAAGFEYAITPKTTIASTVEWFSKQEPYEVITPGSHSFLRNIIVDNIITFDENAVEESSLIQVTDEAESVLNIAVAIEQVFTPTIKGYLSFLTDHESNPNLGGNSLGITTWDIYHLTLGVALRRKLSELAVGLTYSFGRPQKNFLQLANFANIGEENLLGEPQYTTAEYDAFSVVIGYTYFFDIR